MKAKKFDEEADLILEGLHLGSQQAGAAPLEQLRARGISHVLIPAHLNDFEYAYHGAASGLTYKQLHVEDNPRYPILPLLPEAIAFIDEGRRRVAGNRELVHPISHQSDGEAVADGGRHEQDGGVEGGGTGVLVHCQFGVSRSASFVIAYVMALRGWDFDEAFRFVGARRRQVASNLMMFRDQLKLWHRLRYSLPPSLPMHATSSSDSSSSSSDPSSSVVASLTAQERKFLVRHAKNM